MKKFLLGLLVGLLIAGCGFGIYYYLTKDKADEKEVKDEDITEAVTVDVEKENANLMPKVLKMLGAGGAQDLYFAIMDKESDYSIFDSMEKTTIETATYYVTDTLYSDYEAKLKEMFTESGIDSIFSQITGGKDNIINSSDKAAVASLGKTGISYQYKSQELISSDNGTYVFKVTYAAPLNVEATETEDHTMQITGKVVDSKYLIDKIERQ